MVRITNRMLKLRADPGGRKPSSVGKGEFGGAQEARDFRGCDGCLTGGDLIDR